MNNMEKYLRSNNNYPKLSQGQTWRHWWDIVLLQRLKGWKEVGTLIKESLSGERGTFSLEGFYDRLTKWIAIDDRVCELSLSPRLRQCDSSLVVGCCGLPGVSQSSFIYRCTTGGLRHTSSHEVVDVDYHSIQKRIQLENGICHIESLCSMTNGGEPAYFSLGRLRLQTQDISFFHMLMRLVSVCHAA